MVDPMDALVDLIQTVAFYEKWKIAVVVDKPNDKATYQYTVDYRPHVEEEHLVVESGGKNGIR